MIERLSFLREVCGICAMGMLILAAPASAGTIVEFEARCLLPMLEARGIVTDGLSRVEDQGTEEIWIGPQEDWRLVSGSADAGTMYCAVIGDFTWDESNDWAQAGIASGNFELIETEPLRLRSTDPQAPRIDVEFDALVPSVMAIDMNMEG